MNTIFKRSRHVLAVQDFAVSLPFYRDVLGCEIEVFDGGNWAFAKREGVIFMLGECKNEVAARSIGDHSYVAYIEVDGIDELYDHIEKRGGKIRREIRNEPWGMKEFPVESPDGHRFMIGEEIN